MANLTKVRHTTGRLTLSTGLLSPQIFNAGNCRSCGGDGGWSEEGEKGERRWITCRLCGGSGSR
jgi:hypothetical protein